MNKLALEQLRARAVKKIESLKFAITQSAFTNIRRGLEEELQLAEFALAATNGEPVAEITEDLGRLFVKIHYPTMLRAGDKLYRHAHPAVDSDFIPKNLDRALGVLGLAIPESREEFNFQAELWIQRLIDRVIRYADEFKEHPAPVVREPAAYKVGTALLESMTQAIAYKADTDLKIIPLYAEECRVNADMPCRAAMLAAAPQEVGDA